MVLVVVAPPLPHAPPRHGHRRHSRCLEFRLHPHHQHRFPHQTRRRPHLPPLPLVVELVGDARVETVAVPEE